MSTREMICGLINDKVSNDDLELLYQLVLKFIPTDAPYPDETEALKNTENEIEFIHHNDIEWDQ